MHTYNLFCLQIWDMSKNLCAVCIAFMICCVKCNRFFHFTLNPLYRPFVFSIFLLFFLLPKIFGSPLLTSQFNMGNTCIGKMGRVFRKNLLRKLIQKRKCDQNLLFISRKVPWQSLFSFLFFLFPIISLYLFFLAIKSAWQTLNQYHFWVGVKTPNQKRSTVTISVQQFCC